MHKILKFKKQNIRRLLLILLVSEGKMYNPSSSWCHWQKVKNLPLGQIQSSCYPEAFILIRHFRDVPDLAKPGHFETYRKGAEHVRFRSCPCKLKLPVARQIQAECTAVTSPSRHSIADSTEQKSQRREGNIKHQAEWTHYQNGEINYHLLMTNVLVMRSEYVAQSWLLHD